MVGNIPGYGLLTCMCLASLLYHRKWIVDSFAANHIVCCSSFILRQADIIAKCTTNPEVVIIAYPWTEDGNGNHVYSGIPLHSAIMQQLTYLQANQKNLIENFINKVKVALEEFGIDSERMTVENLHHILDQFWNKLTRDLEGFRRGEQGGAIQDVANHIDRDGYMLHSYAICRWIQMCPG